MITGPSLVQLRAIYEDSDENLRDRIVAAATCLEYEGAASAAHAWLQCIGANTEIVTRFRLLALKHAAEYEQRRKPPPAPLGRDSICIGIAERFDAAAAAQHRQLRLISGVANDPEVAS